MTMRCTVCSSPERYVADDLLARGATLGAAMRATGLSGDALARHRRHGHVPPLASRSKKSPVVHNTEEKSEVDTSTVEGRLTAMKDDLEAMKGSASPNAMVAIIAEQRRIEESRGRLIGPPVADRITYKEVDGWQSFEEMLMRAVEEHDAVYHAGGDPASMARKAVADAAAKEVE